MDKHSANRPFFDTSLHFAVKNNLKEKVEILVKKGADVGAYNHNYETPLDIAVRQNATQIVDILLTNAPNLKQVIQRNPRILDYVMKSCDDSMRNLFFKNFTFNDAMKTGNVALIKLFLQRGSNVEAALETGIIPLHYAISCNFEATAHLLLDHGADANSKDQDGSTALHKAVMKNASTELIDRLLENRATLNAKDNFDMTPLNYAIEKRNVHLISKLLDKNPDLDDKGNKLAFCLSFVNGNKHYNFTKIFTDRGFTLVLEDFNDIVVPKKLFPFLEDKFKNSKFRSRVQDTLNKTATNLEEFNKLVLLYKVLKNSVEKGFIDIVENLLAPSMNVNIPLTTGLTMLQTAVTNGHLPVVEKLLACGADINALDESGKMSAIYFSASHQREEMTRFLLKNNANIELRNERNQTPLDLAVCRNNYKIALFFLNAGANLNPDNVNGMNPFLKVAITGKNLKLVKALLHFGALVDYQNFVSILGTFNLFDKDMVKIINLVFNHTEVCGSDSSVVLKLDFNPLSSKCKRLIIKYAKFHGSSIEYDSSESKWSNFQMKCEEEIEKMKITRIEGFSVTVDEVMRTTSRQIAQYLYNEDFVRVVEKMDFGKTFPLYGSKIKTHFKKGDVTKRLLESSSNCLEHISSIHLPKLVKDEILSFLNDQELRCLFCALSMDEEKKAAIGYKDEDKVEDDEDDYNDDDTEENCDIENILVRNLTFRFNDISFNPYTYGNNYAILSDFDYL